MKLAVCTESDEKGVWITTTLIIRAEVLDCSKWGKVFISKTINTKLCLN